MKTTLVTTIRELEELRPYWETLHARVSGNVFQSLDWLLTWWSVYGSRFRLRVFCVWHDSDLVGVFPCFVWVIRRGPFQVSVLRMVGEHQVYGEYHPLVHPEFAENVITLAYSFLSGELSTPTCDLIDFHHYSSSSSFMQQLLSQLERNGYVVKVTEQSLQGVRLRVPPDWETYLQTLGRNTRQTIGRMERRLLKNGATLEMIMGEEYDQTAFNDFVSLHTKVWLAKGTRGFFVERDGFEEFLREITGRLIKKKQAIFFFFSKEDTRFAGLLTFFVNGFAHLYLTGRDPEHPLANSSPGVVLLAVGIREAINRGYRVCDLTEGTTPYKFSLGGKPYWYSSATVFRHGLTGLLGRVCFAILSSRRRLVR